MLWIVCLLLTCHTLVLICLFGLSVRLLARAREKMKDEALATLREFISAPDADTPSPLAALTDTFATLLAARLVQNVKAMLAGVESGASKGEQLALMDEAMDKSPWLGLIGGMLPKRLRNSLMRNPQMIAALSRIGGNNHGVTNEGATAPRRHNRD